MIFQNISVTFGPAEAEAIDAKDAPALMLCGHGLTVHVGFYLETVRRKTLEEAELKKIEGRKENIILFEKKKLFQKNGKQQMLDTLEAHLVVVAGNIIKRCLKIGRLNTMI